MSVNADIFRSQQFGTNIALLLQQKGSKLRHAMTEGRYVGKSAEVVSQVGSVEATEVTTRFAPMPRTDAGLDRRWVFPSIFDLNQQMDTFDEIKMIVDPKHAFVTSAVYALGRKIDAKIIAAFTGSAKTGEAGATSTSFTSGNEVDVAVGGSNSRLNVEKLRAVRELAMSYDNDMDNDPMYCAITAKDDRALLNEIEITSADFNGGDRPVLKDGKIMSFLGINFIHCELLETLAAGTNEVNIPVWFKSGMHLGMWNEIETRISQRNDIQGEPWQAYCKGVFGATRTEENKVFNIESYRA